ncbi:hypothetical protein LXL04_024026 [Taraxacum kok-saghyz]
MNSLIRNGKSVVSLVCVVLLVFGGSVHGRRLLSAADRPKPSNAPAFARWLVSQSSWGVLSTIAEDLGGAPFGNVVSFSDGLPEQGKGVPYFYLTSLDPTARYGSKDHRSSFTLSEEALGTCGKIDPEEPTCAKITLTGKLNKMDANSEEADTAKKALFAKHPDMKKWPKDHSFQVYKLDIEDIFMINFYGGPKPLTVDEYIHFEMNKVTKAII